MPRTSIAPAIRPSRTQRLTGGKESPEPTDRLMRLETMLERLEQRLDVQVQRIAELHARLDQAIADRLIKVTR